MKRHHIVIGVVVIAILLLTGIGVVLYGISRGGNILGVESVSTSESDIGSSGPLVEITPPPSLSEIADEIRPDYPELADLLENPELGSVYKDFYLIYQRGGQEAALDLARQRGILNEDEQIVMHLILDTEDAAPLILELEAEGILIEASFRNRVNILIPVSIIEAQIQNEEPDLIVDRISQLDHVIRLEFPQKAKTKQGNILGQGVNVTLANSWHSQGITGAGIKIGVLDLGFAGYQDLAGTELPENMNLQVFGDDTDLDTEAHGTACAEIVHEMAPGAEIVLAYYDGSDAAFGEAVSWLISEEVDIISNSTGSNGLTPMDGTGFVAELVDEAHANGIFWVNAAGNEADAHYRGQFSDTDADNLHEFSAATETIPFTPYEPGVEVEIILSWDDWDKVDQDYELHLYNEAGTLLASSEETQDGNSEAQYPVEGIFYVFDDDDPYFLGIENYDGLARGDATFDIFVHGASIHPDFDVPAYSLSSPSDARGAYAIAAVHWADDILEFYSSNGPTNDGRIKPDLAAPSVVDSASYSPYAFNGTSAAAPHVAGAAALVLEAFPEFFPDDVATFFQERALDLGPVGPDNAFGAGRLNLGASPQDANPPENLVPISNDIAPTSTPRPSELAVGLPGQSPGLETVSEGSSTGDDSGDIIIFAGLCLICLGGVLTPVLIVGGFIMMRRK